MDGGTHQRLLRREAALADLEVTRGARQHRAAEVDQLAMTRNMGAHLATEQVDAVDLLLPGEVVDAIVLRAVLAADARALEFRGIDLE
jgi:hypothetical protein